MADHAPTREQLVEQALAQRTRAFARLSAKSTATVDQELAAVRQVCLDAGIDLDDPDVAELVLRTMHAISPAVAAMGGETALAIAAAAMSSSVSERIGALARWYVSGHIIQVAVNALAIDEVQP